MVKYKRKIFNRNEQVFLDKGYKFDVDGNVISPFNSCKRRGGENKTKYIHIGFTYEGKPIGVLAHRLQAYIKYGDAIYARGIVVRHLDGNPRNNRYENIGIGTALDNWNDYLKHEKIKHDRFKLLCESSRGIYSFVNLKVGEVI